MVAGLRLGAPRLELSSGVEETDDARFEFENHVHILALRSIEIMEFVIVAPSSCKYIWRDVHQFKNDRAI